MESDKFWQSFTGVLPPSSYPSHSELTIIPVVYIPSLLCSAVGKGRSRIRKSVIATVALIPELLSYWVACACTVEEHTIYITDT